MAILYCKVHMITTLHIFQGVSDMLNLSVSIGHEFDMIGPTLSFPYTAIKLKVVWHLK